MGGYPAPSIHTAAQLSSARRTPKSIIARSPRSCSGNLGKKEGAEGETQPRNNADIETKKNDSSVAPLSIYLSIYLSEIDNNNNNNSVTGVESFLSLEPTELIHAGDGITNRSLLFLFLRGAMSFPNSSTQMGWDETHTHTHPYPPGSHIHRHTRTHRLI